MQQSTQHRDMVPISAAIVFGVMATAGSTKVTFAAITIWALVSRNLLDPQTLAVAALEAVLGAGVLLMAIALILRKVWARKPLLVLTVILFFFDSMSIGGIFPIERKQLNSSALTYASINLIAYAIAAGLLMTRRVANYADSARHDL